jgi:signal peptidase II
MPARVSVMPLALAAAAAVALLDQLSKWWIVERVMDPPRALEITGFLNLMLIYNRGVSFGLLDSEAALLPWLLSGLAVAIVIGLVAWLRHIEGRWPGVAVGLIVGGALGNVVDRLRLGAVIDFLDLHWAGFHWPAFNLADGAITLGVALLLLDGLFGRRKSPR